MAANLPSGRAYSTGDDDLGLDILSPRRENAFYGAATDSDIQAILNDYYQANPDRYGTPETPDLFEYPRPSGYPDEGGGGERADLMRRTATDPQEFIRTQLAGDVVPMYPGAPSAGGMNIERAMNALGPGARGMYSVGQGGGSSSPYLDLLNILAYPQGGQLLDRLRQR
jgi:hypothetical protein